VTFKTNNLAADQQRVYYAWSTGGEWKASNLPRFEYGGRGALYKLQMATIISAEAAGGDQDSCKNFLTELLRSGWSLEG
jgi:hypothetical protein